MLLMMLPVGGFTVFTIVDRLQHLKRRSRHDSSVKVCLESILAEINHRIWLCRNVVWWLILPVVFVADAGFRCYLAWGLRTATAAPIDAAGTIVPALVESGVTGVIVYYLFRWLIQKSFQPRKQELETLLRNLDG